MNTNKNNSKVLSVSIAAYNVQNYIVQTLDSLICDAVIDKIEVLVIDDGSSDETCKIAKEYEARYPQSVKVISKENGGWGSTVNTGMDVACGKYFKLLDGDDFFEKENLEEYIKYLEKVDDDIVLSAYEMFDHTKEKIYAVKTYSLEENKRYTIDDVIKKCTILMHGLAVKKEIVESAKIHIVDHCFYTDTQFVTELVANSSTASFFSKPIYCYRVGLAGQSVSVEGMLKHLGDNLRVAKEMLLYKQKLNLTEDISKWYDGKINLSITQELYAYCHMKKKERLIKFKELKVFIRENKIDFYSDSKEVNWNIKTDYMFSPIIHFFFDLVRKASGLLRIDLLQQNV